MLARASDIAFLQLIWAVDALQSDRVSAASKLISFPPEAADSTINSRFAIHRWELETLTIQLFLTPKQKLRPGPNLILDCSKFQSAGEATNRLRKLEDVESALYLVGDFNVFDEMHRIGQRQFHWQTGYFNLPQFYRYMFVYGQGQCAEYFSQKYGLRTTEFALVAFAYFAAYQEQPWQTAIAAPAIGLTRDIAERALSLLSISFDQARAQTAAIVQKMNDQHGRPLPTAYLPSVLRRCPLITSNEHVGKCIAPIPEIIIMRATSGLYFDLIDGGQELLNEANERFEQYCAQYIAAMMSRFVVARTFRYGPKGTQFDSPDIIINDGGKVVLVVECKATKLTYLAQFAEDPFEAQRKQYQQIAKGVFQLWRYFSHVRRGILEYDGANAAHAMVLTLDPFAAMGRQLRTSIIDEARRLADEEGNISENDRRDIIICPVQELEQVLHTSNEDIFLASLKAASGVKYDGWQFREVHRDSIRKNKFGDPRKFPFDLGQLLPWWAEMQNL